ncbi:SDR family NAD(P)-dependent oxidoreductase, partial [Streptomyces albiaxialis]
RLLAPVPEGWTYAQAAGSLSGYLAAWHTPAESTEPESGGENGIAVRALAPHWRPASEAFPALTAPLGDGVLRPLPVAPRDTRRAAEGPEQPQPAAPVPIPVPVRTFRPPLDPDGTVLVTGGTGALAGVVARHLAGRHGVRRLLLAGRRGPDAPGADALAAELSELGAEAEFAACDASDRAELAALLASVPDDRPLTAVVHTAAVVRDATVQSATPEQYAEVLRAKAASAWHLHDLTREKDLAALVLFSSVTGLAGGAGQGSYAAGNAFLDALAQHRRALGLPGTSLAWGFWDLREGMSGEFTEADRARNARAGDLGLAPEQALALLDTALGRDDEALLVPVRLDLPGMRRRAGGTDGAGPGADGIPVVFRHLVRGAAPRGGPAPNGGRDLARSLATLSGPGRRRALLDLVCAQAAAVIGHESGSSVPATQNFRELGFDSLTAVELRNRLGSATGMRLPATLVFDHPTPTALAELLDRRLGPADGAGGGPGGGGPADDGSAGTVLAGLDTVATAVTTLAEDERRRVAARLEELLLAVAQPTGGGGGADPDENARLRSATDAELFDMLDSELSGHGRPGSADHDMPSERD